MTTQTFALALILSLFTITESWAACSTGCTSCDDDNKTCLQCSGGYFLKDGICFGCFHYGMYGANGCQYNDEIGRVEVTKCESSHTLVNGECILQYPCPSPRVLVNGECLAEAFRGCINMNSWLGKCVSCYSGFKLVNGVCVEDEDYVIPESNMANCIYQSSSNYCYYCVNGYVPVNGHCTAISSLPECVTGGTYAGTGRTCRSGNDWACAKGYYKRINHADICQQCENAKECEDYTGNAIECKAGYYMQKSPSQNFCTSNCKYVNEYANATTGKCEKKPDGCKNVNSDGTCADEKCWKGYAKNTSGICEKVDCPENCEDCTIDKQCTECSSGYLIKEGGCVEASSCTGEYIVDSANNECIKMPGCIGYANGACGSCERGYLKKGNGCVSAIDGCGNGYLEKDGSCISAANGCGSGYKNMGGYCNRVRWTPAEAAEVLNDDDNNTVTLIFKM